MIQDEVMIMMIMMRGHEIISSLSVEKEKNFYHVFVYPLNDNVHFQLHVILKQIHFNCMMKKKTFYP